MELIIAHHEISIITIGHVLLLVSIGYVSNLVYRCFVRLFGRKKEKKTDLTVKLKTYIY